jgi:hypothetical protein
VEYLNFFHILYPELKSRDGSVGIATGYGLNVKGSSPNLSL